MEKMKVKCSIAKVNFGKTLSLKEFAVVEGISPDIGIFKVFVPPELGKVAQHCSDYADNTYMYFELYTSRDYSVRCKVTDFVID